jgi:CRP-like cAMP-binding protein
MNIFQNDAGAVSFPAGQTIFKHGEPSAGKMFAVSEGEVDIQINDHALETIGPGGIFGEMGLIDNHPRSANAIAKTEVKVVAIDERRFNFLVQHNPFFALQVMRVMTERIRRLSETPNR